MRTWRFVLGAVLLASVASAHAHAHLHNSTPANASVVTTSPPAITLAFSETVLVTAAWLQKDDGAKEKLGPLPQKRATEASRVSMRNVSVS